jgi:hypothetical protein
MIFGDGIAAVWSIHGAAGGGKDKAAHPGLRRLLNQGQAAEQVAVGVVDDLLVGIAGNGGDGQVVNGVYFRQNGGKFLRLGEITGDVGDTAVVGKTSGLPGQQINKTILSQQFFDQMLAHEAGAACYQYLTHTSDCLH